MIRISLAFLGLAAVLLCLYIFSYIKKLNTLAKISACSIIPCCGAYAVLFLFSYIPDAANVIAMTLLSFITAETSIVLLNVYPKKFGIPLARIFYLVSSVFWINIYFSTFFMYKVPLYIHILSAIVFASGVITFLFVTRKKSISFYVWAGVSFFISSFFLYCGILTLSFTKKIYGILLTGGAAISEFIIVHHLLQSVKNNFKHGIFIRTILFILSEVLTATAGIFMFYLN